MSFINQFTSIEKYSKYLQSVIMKYMLLVYRDILGFVFLGFFFCLLFCFFYFKIFFFSNLFAEVGGQELEPPAFLPELLNTPERILSKKGLSFTFCNIAWQWESLYSKSITGKCEQIARNSSQNGLITEVRPGQVWGQLLSFIFLQVSMVCLFIFYI